TGKNAAHVIVLSIPDWSVTPFAAGKNTEKISKEIDQYNAINKTISERYGVAYLDITTWTREAASDLSLLADDRLHPSGKEYTRWAAVLKTLIKEKISH
ncbi:MAG: SGNH/GDSL hydrolase family protein, partial [Bacteroidetes bacterium]|nr:SGNH/GDSL hydrolase family protein [Bacteroidota bacterium]